MTVLTREQLVDELTVANEEAEYHSERSNQLEQELRTALSILRDFWGLQGSDPTKENRKAVRATVKRNEEFLRDFAKKNLL